MKVVILAGGMGARLSEETGLRPKPMIEIGARPILWHIMKIYSSYGFNDFLVLLGYRGYQIKEYFSNYFLYNSNVTFDLAKNKATIHNHKCEPWQVTLIDTGRDAMTGSRIKRAQEYVGNSTFMLTYGDGVGDINIKELLAFHKAQGKAVTVTAVQPKGRYGTLNIEKENEVTSFHEKPKGDRSWISGGFFVCEPKLFSYIAKGDNVVFERAPLKKLAAKKQLAAYKHYGFWKCMDVLRDKLELEELWKSGKAPWKVWRD